MLERTSILLTMNTLSNARRAQVVRALVDGASVRATGRMTRTDKDTVLRILVEVGEFCSLYQHHALRNLECKVIEADEIWAFVGAKEANKTNDTQGDLWTWTALCADTKLAVSWLVGPRNSVSARAMMRDLYSRLKHRVQLSTDKYNFYRSAVEEAFGWNGVDYAMIQKVFGMSGGTHSAGRYSPSTVVVEVEKVAVMGQPKMNRVSTSYVERQNLNMRMNMRRFTRLTNGFSKKAENHAHAVSLHFMAYNYCRPHGTLTKERGGIKTTPAMANGLTDHVWTYDEIIEKMDPKRTLSR
jgi:IS1 family transposase